MHPLQQLPLLAAAGVIDKVPGENLFELSHGEVLDRLFVVQIGQRGPDPPLCRRTDLQREQSGSQQTHSPIFGSSTLNRRRPPYLHETLCRLQVQEGRRWSVLLLLLEKESTRGRFI